MRQPCGSSPAQLLNGSPPQLRFTVVSVIWSPMSEADRVFARMTTPGSHPAPEDKEFLSVTSKRRGAVAGQSRTVEVVHRRSDRTAPRLEPAHLHAPSTHAATWPEGFPARPAPSPPLVNRPDKTPDQNPSQVGHVMPGWEPLLAPVQPDEPAAEPVASPQRRPRVARPPAGRRFADPFAPEDTGANCLRCGYLIEPGRERRGLMTCASCG